MGAKGTQSAAREMDHAMIDDTQLGDALTEDVPMMQLRCAEPEASGLPMFVYLEGEIALLFYESVMLWPLKWGKA